MFKLRQLFYFMIITFISMITMPVTFETELVANASSDELVLTAIIRDFKAHNEDGGHPDFQVGGTGLVTGLVENELGQNKKPVLTNNNGVRQAGLIESADSFSQWYTDVQGVNMRKDIELVLEKQSDGSYVYSTNSFFPIDDDLFGNYSWNNYAHNFHFTTEIATQFAFRGDEEFSFRGDDDVWVFINDRLAVDIGGVHGPISRTVNLGDPDVQDELNISPGNTYELRVFHAERQTVGSNFKIQTTLGLQPVERPLDLERNLNKDEYNVNEEGSLTYTFSSSEIHAFEEIVSPDMPPADIVLVIDVSYSMRSQNRMEHAKEAANNFIDNFQGDDVRIGIVRYGARAEVVKGLTSVTNSTELKDAIDGMDHIGGTTNTGDGYRLGYHMLKNNGRENASKHIVLMTDGGSNRITEVAGEFYDGDEQFSNNDYVKSGSNSLADAYIRLFAEKASNSQFNNFLIGFHLSASLEDRLESIADDIGGSFYSADSGDALDAVYQMIASRIAQEQEYFYEDIYMQDTLPEGVQPVVLPSNFSQSLNSDGTYTVTMQISRIRLQSIGDDLFELPEFQRELRVRYLTGGEKSYGDPSIQFKNHLGTQDTGKSTNSPNAFVYSNLVEIQRQIKGSGIYELDLLGNGKYGFDSAENPISNNSFAAKDEAGIITYTLSDEHMVTDFTNPNSFNLFFEETLPLGVEPKENKLPDGINSYYQNGRYTIYGTIEVDLEGVPSYGNTYKSAGQEIEIPVIFESIGEKNLNSLTSNYTHVFAREGEKGTIIVGNNPSIEVFDVTIDEIEIRIDQDGNYALVFSPSFRDDVENVTYDPQESLEVNGQKRTLYGDSDGNLVVIGLGLETAEILIRGINASETLGFKVNAPVFDFDADYVEVFKGDEVTQNVDLFGDIDLNVDQGSNVTNVNYELDFDSSDQQIKKVNNELNLIYTVEEEISPKQVKDLTLRYTVGNDDVGFTNIIRKNGFDILAMKHLIKLSSELVGSQFYNLDVKGDGGKGFSPSENPVDNKTTVANKEPGRIGYEISPVTTVYENIDPFTLKFKETLPEGIKASQLPQGDGFRYFEQTPGTDNNYVIRGEIDMEFEASQGGYRVERVDFDIPVTYSSIGTKELSNESKHEYIGEEREARIENAEVDVFNVEIEKITLKEDPDDPGKSKMIFEPVFDGNQNIIIINDLLIDRESGNITINNAIATIEGLDLGDRVLLITGEANGEKVGFKIEIPVFKHTPDQIMDYSGESRRQRVDVEGLEGTLVSAEALSLTTYEENGHNDAGLNITVTAPGVELVDDTLFYVNYTLLDQGGHFDNEGNMSKIVDFDLSVVYKGEDGVPIFRRKPFYLEMFSPAADVN